MLYVLRCPFWRGALAGLAMITASLSGPAATYVAGQDRDTRVRNDRDRFADDDEWFYNDLDAARRTAGELSKPLMVVLRCIP